MRKCFPDLVSRIDHFRFNNTAENESASRNRSSETKLTGSRTKRKSVMKVSYILLLLAIYYFIFHFFFIHFLT